MRKNACSRSGSSTNSISDHAQLATRHRRAVLLGQLGDQQLPPLLRQVDPALEYLNAVEEAADGEFS